MLTHLTASDESLSSSFRVIFPAERKNRSFVYRAIFGDPALSRYAESAVPSIHIIVKNGNVTPVGVVDSETDKNLVNLRANAVPNVFSVKNELVVTASK